MIKDLKILLGFDPDEEDDALDKKLNLILSSVQSRLKVLLCGLDPPEELAYIIIEVSTIRFNRIGSEGMDSHTVEGESTSYSDNDFAGFAGDIQAFLDRQNDSGKGRVKFL